MAEPRIVVVDASVALKWIIQEDTGVETARDLLRGEPYMLAPGFWNVDVRCGASGSCEA